MNIPTGKDAIISVLVITFITLLTIFIKPLFVDASNLSIALVCLLLMGLFFMILVLGFAIFGEGSPLYDR